MCCGDLHTAEHTMFVCPKWNDLRDQIRQNTGEVLTAENMITVMSRNENTYNEVFNHTKCITMNKERDRRQQEQNK